MKVKLLTTCLVQGGKRYKKGDELDVSEYVYNTHITRFEKIAAKPTAAKKVITNNEPTKEKGKEKKVTKAPVTKTSDKPKPKSKSKSKSKQAD